MRLFASADRLDMLDIGPRGAIYQSRSSPMNKPHIFRTPGGEELVVMARDAYEELQDSVAAALSDRDPAAGKEEMLASAEVDALRKASTPLAFWRKKRALTQSALAADIGVSQNFLSDIERGKAIGDVVLYAKLARRLGIAIEDLVPAHGERAR
jgi:DNA-binding XRE family transcriptional regulator